MSDALQVRRELYEQLRARAPRSRRKALRRQIDVLARHRPSAEGDGGTAGVREPRRPLPPDRPAAAERVQS